MTQVPGKKRPSPCITQDEFNPTFGQPPRGEHAGRQDRPGIVVGVSDIIPRWTANKTDPTKLLYFVVRDGFASDADKKYAADAFQAAAKQWNDIGFGVNISAAPDKARAHFLVKYYKPKMGDRDENTLARAFFPNSVSDVVIYDTSLTDPFWRKYLMNTLLHEIGHIIGLRHEFALDRKQDGTLRESTPAQRFGSVNEHSVMSYDDINDIKDTDIKDVKAFYELENRSLLNGVPITDYTPKPLGP
ncbi:hypothetical protein BKA66DRAFT_443588 [Pyrenochaeta sp. MPI-SDFR-AT-0127]|nr:hypothetical protein BKA66DRAFT_443588 [Pyrenochaeta sp. MPI-SDFR-AT-0127]